MDERHEKEIESIKERYAKRKQNTQNYDILLIASLYTVNEREIVYARIIKDFFGDDLSEKKIIEIGAGSGSNLLHFHRLGFKWENIYANELLDDRYSVLRERLPNSTCIRGDASKLDYANEFDVVFQSTVFTSILDKNFRKILAEKMFEMLKPGGIIISYDFTYNNPQNKDVMKLTKKDIINLFADHRGISFKKVTLAPPISRRIGRLYDVANFFFPFLRTHLIAVIKK